MVPFTLIISLLKKKTWGYPDLQQYPEVIYTLALHTADHSTILPLSQADGTYSTRSARPDTAFLAPLRVSCAMQEMQDCTVAHPVFQRCRTTAHHCLVLPQGDEALPRIRKSLCKLQLHLCLKENPFFLNSDL